jgi:mycofactocin precursor
MLWDAPSVAPIDQICSSARIHHPTQQESPVNNPPTIEAYPAVTAAPDGEPTSEPVAEQVVEEALVEEVSIDGMCGVY